jgi:hypothetical protein
VLAPRQPPQRRDRLFGAVWLAVDPSVERDDGVDAQDRQRRLAGARGGSGDRTRLEVGVLSGDRIRRRAVDQLIRGRDADLERDPQLLQDRAPLRRA